MHRVISPPHLFPVLVPAFDLFYPNPLVLGQHERPKRRRLGDRACFDEKALPVAATAAATANAAAAAFIVLALDFESGKGNGGERGVGQKVDL